MKDKEIRYEVKVSFIIEGVKVAGAEPVLILRQPRAYDERSVYRKWRLFCFVNSGGSETPEDLRTHTNQFEA